MYSVSIAIVSSPTCTVSVDRSSRVMQTMTTMLHFILAMVQHPEVLAKTQEEIDRVIDPGRLPTLSDRPSLPYIECE